MWEFAKRTKGVNESETLAMSAKAAALKAAGHDVISLAAGEPDAPTPDPVQQAATDAMHRGFTRYAPPQGYLALREAIAAKTHRDYGYPVHPDEVFVTGGAKMALYLALQTLLDPGDSVLLPTPAWVSYRAMVELCGAQVIPIPLDESQHFALDLDKLKGCAVPLKTRGIILNTPHSPTGTVLTREELMRLAGWALQRNLWIMVDEVYDKLVYEGNHVPMASLGPEVQSQTITINSFSKTYSMTGWRLGYAIAPKKVIAKMTAIQSQSLSHPTSFVQMAGIAALKLPQSHLEHMCKTFRERRDFCVARLNEVNPLMKFGVPHGAFYFFVDVQPWLQTFGKSDAEFCHYFLEKYHVGVVPGSAFGKDGYVRLSYASSLDQLKKGLSRFAQCINEINEKPRA